MLSVISLIIVVVIILKNSSDFVDTFGNRCLDSRKSN
jgi:hypothetical protein